MIKRTAGFIVKHLQPDTRLQKEQVEICQYGMEMILSTMVNIISVLVIGCIGKCILESIIFLICFSLLRQETGGFHASTYLTCNLSLILCYSLELWMYKHTYGILGLAAALLIYGVHFFIWYFYMPVEHKNKPLTPNQRKKARKKAFILSAFYGVISFVCFFLGFYPGLILFYTVVLIDVLALISVMKRRMYKDEGSKKGKRIYGKGNNKGGSSRCK